MNSGTRRGFYYLLILILILLFFSYFIYRKMTAVKTEPITRTTFRQMVENLPEPASLRICCPFGYNLKLKLMGIKIPYYQFENVVAANSLGKHQYHDSFLYTLADMFGVSQEHNGLVYTTHGGFIDTAHVRSSADMTFFLFSKIWPHLGKEQIISLRPELAERQMKLFAFSAPTDEAIRYTLAAHLSGYLAFHEAAWHELVQWYGYESFNGFSEGVSAFSPEDLYSNLLGVRLAINVILEGQVRSVEQFNQSMQTVLPVALRQLGAVSSDSTRSVLDKLDGIWWNSQRFLPDKFLVMHRSYQTQGDFWPTPVPGEQSLPRQLKLPVQFAGYMMEKLGELQLRPGRSMKDLPVPATYYTFRDFPLLASTAREQDILEFKQLNKE